MICWYVHMIQNGDNGEKPSSGSIFIVLSIILDHYYLFSKELITSNIIILFFFFIVSYSLSPNGVYVST